MLCDKLKELDEEQPPKDCQDIEKWHKEQDVKQQDAFKAALEKLKGTWLAEDIAPALGESEIEEQKK